MKKILNKKITVSKKINKSKMIISLFCSLALATTFTFGIYAANISSPQRTESVYVSMSPYGDFEKGTMYVDTILSGTKKIVDHGKFKSVENMTNKIEAKYDENNNLIWDLTTYNGESFAYNVELDDDTLKNIPWTFDISYELNGKEADPNQIAHEAGLVKITVHCIPNKNSDEFYQNNYMMEVTSDFDMNDFISVTSDDALETITGKIKTLMFIVLPGQDKTFDIMLGTEDFQYDGLTFAMVPLTGEISDKIVDLIQDKQDLEDAYNASMKGTDVVLNSLGSMTSSLNKAASGMSQLKTGTIKMHDLQGQRDVTVEELDKEITQFNSDIDQVEKDIEEYKTYLLDLEKYTNNLSKDLDDLEEIAEDIPDLTTDLRKTIKHSQKLVGLMSEDVTDTEKDITEKLTSVGTDYYTMKAKIEADPTTYASLIPTFTTMGGDLTNLQTALQSMSKDKYNNIYSDLGNLYNDTETLEEYGDVFDEICEDTNDVLELLEKSLKYINKEEQGIDSVSSMVSTLDDMTKTISDAMPSIKSALNILSTDLYNGAVNTLNGLTDVTKELANVSSQAETFMNAKNKVDNVVRSNWEDIDNDTTLFEMDPNAKVISFSSSENDEPNKVQIFLKAPEIKEVIDDDLAVLQSDNEKTGFWARVASLFKMIWEAIMGIFK